MTNPIISALFELLNRSLELRRHLQDGEEASAILTTDRKFWLTLITLAEQMEIDGLIYDAVLTLPTDQQPDREVMMRWTANVQSIERDNLLYRQNLCEVLQQLEKEGLCPIIMKGITIQQLYPNPLRRPVGDVDLLTPLDHMHRFISCLESLGGVRDEHFDAKHQSVCCKGMNWELHFHSAYFYNVYFDKRYRLLEKEETSMDNLCHLSIDNHSISVLPPMLHLIYLTGHFQHHLLVERATLRQVVDWTLTLHHERTALAISEVTLIRTLNHLGLYRLYRTLGYIATQYLGLSTDSYAGLSNLTKTEAKRGEHLIKILVQGYVPGCKPYEPRLATDNFLRRLHHFAQLCKRCIGLFQFFPQEAIATPFGFMRYAILRRLSK